MPGVFEPIGFTWDGQEYTILPDRIMGAIDAVESVIPIGELAAMVGNPRAIRMGKIAHGFGALLRYAGAAVAEKDAAGKERYRPIKDEEVYQGLFKDGEAVLQAQAAVNTLLALIVPPSSIADGAPKKKAPARGKVKPTAASSRKRSS